MPLEDVTSTVEPVCAAAVTRSASASRPERLRAVPGDAVLRRGAWSR